MGYPSINKKYAQHKYNVSKCSNRKTNKTLKYIVVHYTGTTASAKNNCIYFNGGDRQASADYFVDTDGSIYKFNDNTNIYYSWHCGDGHGKNGITNANSIGIECVSAGKEFTSAQIIALGKLVKAIMADYGVPARRVVRHYDASGKLCPKPYCGNTTKNKKWTTLRTKITSGKATGTASQTTKTTAKLAEDGDFGTKSVKAMQKWLGTTKDGVISGQSKANKKYHSAISAIKYGSGGSDMVAKLQAKVGTTTSRQLNTSTIKALQKYLNKNGASLTVDGSCGKATAKAWQKYLNKVL